MQETEEIEMEKKRILRKLDLRILPTIAFLYLLCCLDRTNIGNVKTDLMNDLDLSEEQYSFAVSVFYFGYILCEIPSNIILKKTRPSLWIGTIVAAWGVASTCMVFVNNYTTLIITRVFLGIAESGFFPGVVFYFTFWYPKKEQGLRVALFYSASTVAGTIGGVLAYAILNLDDVLGLEGWRWLFLLEGVPSIIFGILTWVILPNYPSNSSWLEDDEKITLTNMLKGKDDQPPMLLRNFISTLLNLRVWAFAISFLALVSPSYAIAFYLPSIIEDLGFSSRESNILTTPIYLVATIFILINAFYSDKKEDRSLHVIVPALVGCLGFTILTIATWYDIPQLSYAAMFLASAGTKSAIPIVIAWMTSMVHDWVTVATASGLVVGIGNIGGILGPSLYGFLYIPGETENDEGSYILGHLSMVIATATCVIVSIILKKTSPTKESEREPLIRPLNSQ